MAKSQLNICYLTKKQNAIVAIANNLRSAFPKITACQSKTVDEAIALEDLDLIIADAGFKNIPNNTPALFIISENAVESFVKEGADFITEAEATTYALVRAVKAVLGREKLLGELKEASIKDELTGIYNQRFITETLSREVKKALRYNYPLTVLFMGIDGLRKINTMHGHAIGDKVLIDFGLIAMNSVRAVDTIGRYSGDEFLAILPETSPANSLKVCERIQKATQNFAFANACAGLNVTVGIGISSLCSTIRAKEELLNSARQALAGAKKRGTNCTCTYDEAQAIDEPAKENTNLIVAVQNQISLLTEEAIKSHHKGILNLFGEIPLYKKMLSHSEHVAFFCERLATKMGMSSDDIALIRRSSILHDIGKLVIDERIVMKNGPLTSTEFAIVRQHPVFAAQMLSGSAFVKNEVMAILHHHENFDGNGYPDHMQGTHIPLVARIITLAEAWDTMITPQVYREAYPLDQALSELKKGAGRQFDPELVGIFTSLIEN